MKTKIKEKYKVIDFAHITNQSWQISFLQPIWIDF